MVYMLYMYILSHSSHLEVDLYGKGYIHTYVCTYTLFYAGIAHVHTPSARSMSCFGMSSMVDIDLPT